MDTNYPGVIAGTFASTPLGVILHGSRSGIPNRPTLAEYLGTASFAVGNSAGLGWNITCGTDRLAIHYPATRWGWNARQHSSQYLACEFAQANLGDHITDGQVKAFVWWFRNKARATWPRLRAEFPNHSDLPAGIADGKSDCEPRGVHTVRDRVLAELKRQGG